jgi:hypothetical protein
MPASTAEKGRKNAFVSAAMIRASVVFPEPGGPQKTREGSGRAERTEERNFPSPRIASWPTNSARVFGRIRSASGAEREAASFSPPRRPGNSGGGLPDEDIFFLFPFRYSIKPAGEYNISHRGSGIGRRFREAGGSMKDSRSTWRSKLNRTFPGRFDRAVRLFLLACVCLFASCATTKVTEAWKDDQFRGTIRKVAVLGVFEKPDTRKIFEDEFADRLKARGVEAVASHKFITDAELPDKDVVIGKIRNLGVDTVFVTRVVDMETEQVTVPGRSYLVPRHYDYYGTYYSHIYYTHIYRPGYTVEEGYAYTETNLYSVSDEKLIWSGRSKTDFSVVPGSRPIPRYELIQGFVKIMIDRLSDDKLIR